MINLNFEVGLLATHLNLPLVVFVRERALSPPRQQPPGPRRGGRERAVVVFQQRLAVARLTVPTLECEAGEGEDCEWWRRRASE